MVEFRFKRRKKASIGDLSEEQSSHGNRKRLYSETKNELKCPDKYELRGLSYSQRLGRTFIKGALCQKEGHSGVQSGGTRECQQREKERGSQSLGCFEGEKMVGLYFGKKRLTGVICCS